MRRRRITVDGISSPVIEAGLAEDVEAAVFVHGNPGSSDDFLALVEAAGRQTRAVAMDLPGFGQADKPADWPATIDAYGRHLGGLIDQLGIERAHLVLHDLGGPWGLRWLVDHVDRAASVALVNVVAMPGYSWHHRLARLWRTPGLGEAAMARVPRSTVRLALREGNPTPVPPHHVERMADQFDAATRRTVLRVYRDADPGRLDDLAARLRARLDGVDLPALVVWGEADPYISMAQAERLREVFPAARFVRIRDAGHWPFLSRPDVTNPVLVDWLADRIRIDGRRSS